LELKVFDGHLQQQLMVMVLMATLVMVNGPLAFAWLRNGNVIEGPVSFLDHLLSSTIDHRFLELLPFLALSFLLHLEMRPSAQSRSGLFSLAPFFLFYFILFF